MRKSQHTLLLLSLLLLPGTALLGGCASASFVGAESAANLGKLQKGMSQQQVLNLLGSPDSVVRNGDTHRWIYKFRRAENVGRNAFVEFQAGSLAKTGELGAREMQSAKDTGESGTCTRWVSPDLRMESLCTH
ncbi:outer membrane protein assembly factor BamE [bacterium]|nr:outer membrane protein assembly factor BamE [bacterium]